MHDATLEELETLFRLRQSFRLRLEQGDSPSLLHYLSEVPEKIRPELFRHLFRLEVDHETSVGRSQDIDRYIRSYPAYQDQVLTILGRKPATTEQATDTGRTGEPNEAAIDGHRVLSELGWGGGGIVYEVVSPKDGNRIALKILHEEATSALFARFMTEFNILARLNHPRIVRVFELGMHESRPYYTMELIPGGATLFSWCPKPPYALVERAAANIALSICEPLAYAHEHGIVHRDLKPSNILVFLIQDALYIKIADFGCAKDLLNAQDMTATGAVVGTYQYMAPEQASNIRIEVTPLLDVYAIGGVLFFMLTGQPPYDGVEGMKKLLTNDEPPRPSSIATSVSDAMDLICLRCLAKDPNDRYPNVTALREDLHRFLMNQPLAFRHKRSPVASRSTKATTPASSIQFNHRVLSILCTLPFCGGFCFAGAAAFGLTNSWIYWSIASFVSMAIAIGLAYDDHDNPCYETVGDAPLPSAFDVIQEGRWNLLWILLSALGMAWMFDLWASFYLWAIALWLVTGSLIVARHKNVARRGLPAVVSELKQLKDALAQTDGPEKESLPFVESVHSSVAAIVDDRIETIEIGRGHRWICATVAVIWVSLLGLLIGYPLHLNGSVVFLSGLSVFACAAGLRTATSKRSCVSFKLLWQTYTCYMRIDLTGRFISACFLVPWGLIASVLWLIILKWDYPDWVEFTMTTIGLAIGLFAIGFAIGWPHRWVNRWLDGHPFEWALVLGGRSILFCTLGVVTVAFFVIFGLGLGVVFHFTIDKTWIWFVMGGSFGMIFGMVSMVNGEFEMRPFSLILVRHTISWLGSRSTAAQTKTESSLGENKSELSDQ